MRGFSLRGIGAATVTYVSNIYKYYIAYLLIEDFKRKEKTAEKIKSQRK